MVAHDANSKEYLNNERLKTQLNRYHTIIDALLSSILVDVKLLNEDQQHDAFFGQRMGVALAISMACLFGCPKSIELLLSLDSSFLHYVLKGAVSVGKWGENYIYQVIKKVSYGSGEALILAHTEHGLREFQKKERLEARKKLMIQIIKLSNGAKISDDNLFATYLMIKESDDNELLKLVSNLFNTKKRLIYLLEQSLKLEGKIAYFTDGLKFSLRLGESAAQGLVQELLETLSEPLSIELVKVFTTACASNPEFKKIIDDDEFMVWFLKSAAVNKEILLFKAVLKLGEKFLELEKLQNILGELLLGIIEDLLPIEFVKALLKDAKVDADGLHCRRFFGNSLSGDSEGEHHIPPLIWAASYHNMPAVKVLLDYKANTECIFMPEKIMHLDKRDEEKRKSGTIPHGATPLVTAVNMGFLDLVVLFHQRGADIDFRNHNGASALFLAAQLGYVDIVRYLIQENANIYALNMMYGISARQIAIARKNFEIANLLLAAELRDWVINSLNLSRNEISEETHQKITHLVNCLVNLKAEIVDAKIYILAESFKSVVPNPGTIKFLKIEILHLKKILNEMSAKGSDLSLFIWNILLLSTLKDTAAENIREQRVQLLKQIKEYETKANVIIDEIKAYETYLLTHTPTRIPERWKLMAEERERASRLINKIRGLRPIDDSNDNSFLQERLAHVERYYLALVSINKLFSKKVEYVDHSKDRKISAAQIKTEEIVAKKQNEQQKNTMAIAEVKQKLPPASIKAAIKSDPSRKPQLAKHSMQLQSVPARVPVAAAQYQPKPRPRTFKMVSQLFTKLRCHVRDHQLLDEIVALNLRSDSWVIWMTVNNALLGLCARIADRRGLQRERNALFHHHDLLPIPGNHNLKYYQTLHVRLVSLANDLLHDSAKSDLLASIKAKPISAETLATCIAQLHHGREEIRAYHAVDFDLLSPEILLAAQGFTAARFSTYVMPLIRAKRLGEFEKSSEYQQICRLIEEAKPYITVGGDFRHGKSLGLLLMPPPRNTESKRSVAVSAASAAGAEAKMKVNIKGIKFGTTS